MVVAKECVITVKYVELTTMGVAVTTQWEIYWNPHVNTVKAGAVDTDIAKAAWIASTLRAGGATTHARVAVRDSEGHHH